MLGLPDREIFLRTVKIQVVETHKTVLKLRAYNGISRRSGVRCGAPSNAKAKETDTITRLKATFELAVAGMCLDCPIIVTFRRSATLLKEVTFALDRSMPLVATAAKPFLSNICKRCAASEVNLNPN
jgi:hypothetical protein